MSADTELPAFFSRNGLVSRDAEICLGFAAEQFPHHLIRSVSQQGGCSHTLLAFSDEGEDFQHDSLHRKTIIQFRLLRHAIPIAMAVTASRIYSPLAPKIRELGHITVGDGVCLQASAMTCIPGERFSEVQPRTSCLDKRTLDRCKWFMNSLSTFFAKSWHAGQKHSPALPACTGKVGRSLLFRLGSLERHLPSKALRQRAQQTRLAVEKGGMDPMPVVLTHGDLLPSNILVDEVSWTVKGYVDWAEAEYLSCGICLYGLEHLLGYMVKDNDRLRFRYYDQADELRDAFWTAFEQRVPEIAASSEVREALMLARDVGILLWHGFAWDDGSIDRVVNPVDDSDEVEYLEKFLGIQSAAARHDSAMAGNSPVSIV